MPQRQPAAPRPIDRGAADPACPVEDIAQAYLVTAHGDAGLALRCAITDALSDLMEAERRARENSRLISRGYVRNAARG
ncbi:hypothetical protein [Methylorubrum salsuginis]|uniref:Uncharacterized protein n=1 Tax=Methylorubrum salsuginis TaxID=414703 RepID=A0A1I4KE59_9HYPH|nr:hypothetical protein [Methylorubrum salsuginis]SFL76746.1 hypothetical protein SAMN04488125_1244 [Methylorubrum salsuginis]